MTGNELKSEFLQVLLDRTRLWTYVRKADKALKKMQRAENIIGGNVYSYSEDEARAMFEVLRKSSRFTVLHFTRKFVSWCIEKGVDGAGRGILDFRPEELEEIRKDMVANPIGLQAILDEVYPPESDNTVSNVGRCIAWCGFSGVPYDDALTLTAENIVFPTGLIHVNGNEYILYPESVPTFRSVCENTWFFSDHPNHNHVMRKRVDGDLLLRGITAQVTHRYISERLTVDFEKARSNGKTHSRIKYETLLKSGTFYRVSETETESTPADLGRDIEKRFDDKVKRDGYGYQLHGEDITDKISGVIEDKMYEEYYSWKLAFLPV